MRNFSNSVSQNIQETVSSAEIPGELNSPAQLVKEGTRLMQGAQLQEAVKRFALAAEMGSAPAMHYVAQIRFRWKDFKKAKEDFERAVEFGHLASHYDLGVIYQYGLGVFSDQAKADIHFEKAPESNRFPLHFFNTHSAPWLVDQKDQVEACNTIAVAIATLDQGQFLRRSIEECLILQKNPSETLPIPLVFPLDEGQLVIRLPDSWQNHPYLSKIFDRLETMFQKLNGFELRIPKEKVRHFLIERLQFLPRVYEELIAAYPFMR